MTTTRYHVGFGIKAVVPSEGDFEEFLDAVYTELLAVEERSGEIIDPDMTAKLTEHTFDVEMQVDATDVADAYVCALTVLRSALHTVGAATPRWELVIERIVGEAKSADRQFQGA